MEETVRKKLFLHLSVKWMNKLVAFISIVWYLTRSSGPYPLCWLSFKTQEMPCASCLFVPFVKLEIFVPYCICFAIFSPWHWHLDDPLKIALNNCFCFCGCWISTSQPYELKKRKTLKCSKKGKVFVSKVWSLIRFSAWPFPFYVDIVKKNAFCALFMSLCPIGNIYIFVPCLLCNLVSLTTVAWRLLEHVIEWFPKAGNIFLFPKERAKLKKKISIIQLLEWTAPGTSMLACEQYHWSDIGPIYIYCCDMYIAVFTFLLSLANLNCRPFIPRRFQYMWIVGFLWVSPDCVKVIVKDLTEIWCKCLAGSRAL